MPIHRFQGFNCKSHDRDVWRYMELPDLLWILQNSKINFSSPTSFDDRYEATLPVAWYEFRKKQNRVIEKSLDHKKGKFSDLSEQTRKSMRENSFVNCWHVNETESAAMWKLYGESRHTVAIKTTVDNLRSAFADQSKYLISIGDINYIDFDSSQDNLEEDQMEQIRKVHSGNRDAVGLLLLKRKEFKHENEVRAVILDGIADEEIDSLDYQPVENLSPPVNVEVNLKYLIQDIILPPGCDEWFEETVHQAIKDSNVDEITVENISNSSLDTEPIE